MFSLLSFPTIPKIYSSTISGLFKSKGWKSRHVIQEIFTRETMKTRKAKNVFEAKFGSGEIMSSWETDDRRGDYLLYLHLLASTFLARALSFPFCIRLDDVFRYEEKLFKLSWSFQSSICHKVVIFSGITDYLILGKLKCFLLHLRHLKLYDYNLEETCHTI